MNVGRSQLHSTVLYNKPESGQLVRRSGALDRMVNSYQLHSSSVAHNALITERDPPLCCVLANVVRKWYLCAT